MNGETCGRNMAHALIRNHEVDPTWKDPRLVFRSLSPRDGAMRDVT